MKKKSKGTTGFILKKELEWFIIGLVLGGGGVIAAQFMGYLPCFG